jgi:hypothetical protein
MSHFRALAIESDIVNQVRSSGLDPFGAQAERWVAEDARLPCRHCLHEALLNSNVLLISYRPLKQDTPYAGRGPIFVCADECGRYAEVNALPQIVASRNVNLRAYTASGRMLYSHSRLTAGAEAKEHIAGMLSDEEVGEVHAHTALHGCFLCRFVRG